MQRFAGLLTFRAAAVRFVVWIFLGFALWAPGLGAAPKSKQVFVEAGNPTGIFEEESWTRADGYLEGIGPKNLLFANQTLDTGDFVIWATLEIHDLDKTGAHFRLGHSRFGFFRDSKNLYFDGPLFGEKIRDIEPAEKWLSEGRRFSFRVQKRGRELSFFIDERKVVSRTLYVREPLGVFGFGPGKSRVRLIELSALGSLQANVERRRIPGDMDRELEGQEAIHQAIDAGVDFLLRAIQLNPRAVQGKDEVGQVALETYALLVAGVSQEHPLLRANFEFIEEHIYEKSNTYALSCYVFALDAAIAQLEYDAMLTALAKKKQWNPRTKLGPKQRKQIKEATKTLISGQNAEGGWRYFPQDQDADGSCTQFAALALGLAARRGVRVDSEVWLRLADYYFRHQDAEGPETQERIELHPEVEAAEEEAHAGRKGKGRTGVVPPRNPTPGLEDIEVYQRGFRYDAKREVNWNISCAGLSTLLIVYDQVKMRMRPQQRAKLHAAIRDGYGWVMGNWQPTSSYYGIYSLEKVADLGGVRKFGDHDWYDELARYLVTQQKSDGRWPSTNLWGENSRVTTSFALLVLNRATSILTQSPTERVVGTGVGSQELAATNRKWVFLQELDSCVYYPAFVRALSHRPKVPVLELLVRVCEAYSEEYRPELIPSLVDLRSRVNAKGARKLITKCLTQTAGEDAGTAEQFLDIYRRWQEILEWGESRDDEHRSEVARAYAAAADNVVLKRAAARAVVQCGARQAVDSLVLDLDHSKRSIRSNAYETIRGLFVDLPPAFDPQASPEIRAGQVGELRDWIRRQK